MVKKQADEIISAEQKLTAAEARGHMARGSVWMISMRWGIRILGLVTTVIIARILDPEDFGIFAIAALIVKFCEIAGKAGQDMAVIRHPNPTREYVDASWTLSIIVGIVLGIGIVLSAPAIAYGFSEPRAISVIYILSIRVFIMGFENIGVVMFQRELNFAKEFRYGIYEKIIGAAVTIFLVVWLRNYWALVFGSVIGFAFTIALSYWMHAYRPSISFTKMAEVWSFSGWILISRMGTYLVYHIDRFVVGITQATKDLGVYQVGMELGRLTTFELTQPVGRALFPAYVKLAHDPEEFKAAYVNVLSSISLIAFGASIGFACISGTFVNVVYGSKWTAIIPIVAWSSLTAGLLAIINTGYTVINASGNAHLVAKVTWLQVILFTLSLICVAFFTDELFYFSLCGAFVALIMVPVVYLQLRRVINVNAAELINVVWRPLLASAIMAAFFIGYYADDLIGFSIKQLIMQIALGGAVYVFSILFFWFVAGRPDSIESLLIRKLSISFRRRFAGISD